MIEAKARFAGYLKRRYGERSTAKHYLSDIEMFIKNVGERTPESISAKEIDAFVDSQVKDGLKASTINRRLAALHTFFEFLASEAPEKEQANPVHWRRHGIKEGQLLPRDASDEAVEQLLAGISSARDLALFGLMVGAGLRVGEVIAIGCDDLEAPATPSQCARLRVKGKGEKERMVWLTPKWYGVVQGWLAVRPASAVNQLFLNQHKRALSVAGVQYQLNEYCQQLGLRLSCHQLRHTFARRLAEQGMPTESIAKLLGHEQIATTQRYTSGANLDLRQAFLATMLLLEAPAPAEPAPTSTTTPVNRPRRQPQATPVDLAGLEKALQRLAALPTWLQTPLSDFLRYRWRNWSPQQATVNAQTLSRQLFSIWQWFVTQRQLTDFTALKRRDVEAWLDQRTSAGIAVNTRRTHLTLLFASLHFVAEQGCAIDPAVFRIQPPLPPQLLPRFLPDSDYRSLLQTVYSQTAAPTYRNCLDRAWFLTLAHTGLRSCELLDLRLADLDLKQRRLWVRSGKHAPERILFLSDTLTTALFTYLQQRPLAEDDHLWLDFDLAPLSSARLRYCIHQWGRLAQIAVSPHRLRHTFATQLINRGLPLASVSKLLGHRSLNTTQHYARLHDQTVKTQFEAAMTQIEGILMTDWPTTQADVAFAFTFSEHPCDSV